MNDRSGALRTCRVVLVAVCMIAAACTGDVPDAEPSGEAAATSPVVVSDSTPRPLIEVPTVDPSHPLGPRTSPPSAIPNQAGPLLRGRAVPTNQWWSPALVGPGSGALWAMPLLVEVVPGRGIDLRVPPVVAGENAIVSAMEPPVSLLADIVDVSVEDHGDFSVRLAATTSSGGEYRFTVAQGDPSVTVEIPVGPIVIETGRVDADSPPPRINGSTVGFTSVEGRRWYVVAGADPGWRVDGSRVVATAEEATTLTFVPEPDTPAAEWDDVAERLAASPVVDTEASLGMDWNDRVAVQELRWLRSRDDGILAVLPHHWLLIEEPPPVLGTFATPRGLLRLVPGDRLELRLPATGFVAGVPGPAPDDATIPEASTAIAAEPVGPLGAGSYFGSKHLARLATVVDLARRTEAERDDLERALGSGVRDALEFSGEGDVRWLSYDESWGGLVLQPPEFGSESYNDHHFHYGYLIHAAATLAEGEGDFVSSHGAAVDLLVADVMGDPENPSVPDLRTFNPYLGHSFASGFVAFADGNNQESSSEAVNAWWAIGRWALATGQRDLADRALAHYYVEAHAARAYWLGELGIERPSGYAHQSAGIVWGGKIDFATWFDPRASAAIGIQLLPVNFGSIYRSDTAAAARRFESAAQDLIWPDVAAMDLALASPDRALAQLGSVERFDDGNTAAFASYWVQWLARSGPPDPTVTVDGPYGAAFSADGATTVVGINPGDTPVTVGFHRDGTEIARLSLGPGSSALETLDR